MEKEVEEVNNFHATPPTTRTSFFVSECYCADVGAEEGERWQKLTADVPP